MGSHRRDRGYHERGSALNQGKGIRVVPGLLSAVEQAALDMTADLVNMFLPLLSNQSGDQTDFAHHIHAIQNIILSQPTARANPQIIVDGRHHHER